MQLARVTAQNAARLFNLESKGQMAVGKDADLALVDLGAEWNFDTSRAFTRARANMRAYEARPLRGSVVSTLVRGSIVYDSGEIVAKPGHGRLVRPAPR